MSVFPRRTQETAIQFGLAMADEVGGGVTGDDVAVSTLWWAEVQAVRERATAKLNHTRAIVRFAVSASDVDIHSYRHPGPMHLFPSVRCRFRREATASA